MPFKVTILVQIDLINTNLPPVLHHVRDIAFDKSKIAIFVYPLPFNPPDGGVPYIISSNHITHFKIKQILTGEDGRLKLNLLINNSSAVAEMGDSGHNRHGPERGGACAPFAKSWDPV